MTYEQWELQIPQALKGDAVWTVKAYRLALFLGDLCWRDVTRLLADKRTIGVADQLYRAAGSVAADITEGYSRSSGKDQARFFEYALGSGRQSRNWYYAGRHVLGDSVFEHRAQLLSDIIRLLLTMIPQRRRAAAVRKVIEENRSIM